MRLIWGFRASCVGVLLGVALVCAAPARAASNRCLTGDAIEVVGDPARILASRTLIDAACPCESFDGSAGNGKRAYRRCAKTMIDTLVAAGVLRDECRTPLRRMAARSTCGIKSSAHPVVCVRESLTTGAISCGISTPSSECRSTNGVDTETRCASATHCIDAADTNHDLLIAAPGDTGKCAGSRPTPTPQPAPTPDPFATGGDGKRLAKLINDYRVANGKRALPLSRAMMATAAAHVGDLTDHPGTDSGSCTPHSWSSKGKGLWTGCCYTIDHAQADCMWRKPREISAGLGFTQYQGNGYEIALRGTVGGTPEQVLQVFVDSAPHRAVILSDNGWEFLDAHPAMGAAMRGGYAVVWFGDATDPAE